MAEYETIQKLAEEAINELIYEYHHSVSDPVLDFNRVPPQMVKEFMKYAEKVFRVAAGEDIS